MRNASVYDVMVVPVTVTVYRLAVRARVTSYLTRVMLPTRATCVIHESIPT